MVPSGAIMWSGRKKPAVLGMSGDMIERTAR